MKTNKKFACAFLIFTALLGNGCKKILEEHPQSSIVPSFFNTPSGVLGGIAGGYAAIREATYGTEGFTAEMDAGTDDHLAGGSASGIQLYTYNGINSSVGGAGFGDAYRAINTMNGVLQYGQTIDLDAATRKQYLAQAKFIRAFWYFLLVQKHGDVPLHTEFITVPTKADTRAPVADVYKVIIKDLTEAAADLPNVPTAPFTGKAACKPVAQFLLARVYLTRGWLTNNSADFQQAYTLFTDLIANKATYGWDLWQDYGDAFNPVNDNGKETIFVSDHNIDTKYGIYPLGQAQGGGPYNLLPWFTNFNYPNLSGINSYVNGAGSLVTTGAGTMVRDVQYGRPYTRTRPNTDPVKTGANAGKRYILDQAFVNRDVDSRYENTFYTAWISNVATANTAAAANNTRGISYTLIPGVDTGIYMPPFEVAGAPQFVGTRPFKGIVITPKYWNNNIFPSVKKFMDPSRAAANFNDPSTRPVVIWRFSDVYLLAGEAAFKLGDLTNAAKWINVVRQRAAYRKTNTAAQNLAGVTAMTILPSDVTLDFILDERSREFFAECQRWLDLVRTRTLTARVKAWNNEAAPYVKDEFMLRAIPQNEIDLVTEGPKMPQNPGY
nr:RagB/SusD family nutrient uptake outer membrane protein [uncultured Mucilaginibacter sp.]